MELNTEINKVVGTEISKLLVSKIPEEELENVSREAWKQITERPIKWGQKEPSQLDNMLREQLVKTLLSKIQEIMKETMTDKWIQSEAERIAIEAKEESHKLLVKSIAEHIKESIFYNYDSSWSLANGCEKIAYAITNKS